MSTNIVETQIKNPRMPTLHKKVKKNINKQNCQNLITGMANVEKKKIKVDI
jgi:hypothetical protein